MPATLCPSEQLLYSTVRIECILGDGSSSVGTGFFFPFFADGKTQVPATITNKHVVRGAVRGKFLIHGRNEHDEPDRDANLWVELHDFEKAWLPHPDPTVDLCVLLAGAPLNEIIKAGKRPFFVNLPRSLVPADEELAELMAIEEVIMIGYPSGIWDRFNNMPIVRRGITATHPARSYEGRDEFMIDAACFPGSSGSPILLFNEGAYLTRTGGTVVGRRVKLLGILRAGPQFTADGDIKIVDVPTAKALLIESPIPMNLGIAIKAKRLLDFEAPLRKLLQGDA